VFNTVLTQAEYLIKRFYAPDESNSICFTIKEKAASRSQAACSSCVGYTRSHCLLLLSHLLSHLLPNLLDHQITQLMTRLRTPLTITRPTQPAAAAISLTSHSCSHLLLPPQPAAAAAACAASSRGQAPSEVCQLPLHPQQLFGCRHVWFVRLYWDHPAGRS
jgi:hypothetical protein